MDTSETYIKMCEKAEEIQTSHTFEFDDLCYLPEHRPTKVVIQFQNVNVVELVKIWLPRQDQLQEMYLRDMPDGTYQKVATLAETFYEYHLHYGYPSYAFSMEQLWLAFVMKEKYSKVWTGEGWK